MAAVIDLLFAAGFVPDGQIGTCPYPYGKVPHIWTLWW
ncbi:hypothetical protein CBM2634_U180008 [Cupriavidus taiwanensis]|uniref:Uncharacterized protein n=1 Tax=Cupriavidus taiwanensis TaxID=164546 RepID=A0A375JCR4_9BURK|nr:hypothetical protein CBM2634_U180008 [Cupriavidus taiwanensis]